MTYTILYAPYFEKKVKKIAKNNEELQQMTKSSIEDLGLNPKKYSIRLSGNLKGKRRVRVGNTPFRIIYTFCQECRELVEIKRNRCSQCDEIDDNTVILRNFGHTGKVYKQKIPPI